MEESPPAWVRPIVRYVPSSDMPQTLDMIGRWYRGGVLEVKAVRLCGRIWRVEFTRRMPVCTGFFFFRGLQRPNLIEDHRLRSACYYLASRFSRKRRDHA
jgi:hypothetical protein